MVSKSLGLLSGAMLALAVGTGMASASTVELDLSGNIGGGVGSFTADVMLNVVGGQAISGTGSINVLGSSNALVLITPSTLGNESTGYGPVGFRANDGTDLFGANTAYPISTSGLLFDVGTTTAAWGSFPLFGFWSNGDGSFSSVFDGKVGSTEYYNDRGTAQVSVTPLPPSWTMMLIGVAGFGFVAYRRNSKQALMTA
jgi:hypothetical protein